MAGPFRKLDDTGWRLGQMTVHLTRTRVFQLHVPAAWQPAVNAFRCGGNLLVCVELAGVERGDVQIVAEPNRLAIRGTRATAEPGCDDQPALQVLALEIDHGSFERVIELPVAIDPDAVTAEQRNGLLWLKLPLRG